MDSYQYSIAQMNDSFKITWILSFNGKERYRVRGHFFDHSIESGRSPRDGGGEALFDTYSINFTSAVTTFKEEKARLRIQQISSGTGWYLVKQPETFGDLMKRIFINPSKIDWDIMRENNAHLGNVQMMTLLQAGQVVVVALERNSAKVKQMLLDAKSAASAWQKTLTLEATETFLLDLFMAGGKLVTDGIQDVYSKGINPSFDNYFDITTDYLKPIKDAYGTLNDTKLKINMRAYEVIIRQAEAELSNVTTTNGMYKRARSAVYSAESKLVQKSIKLFDGSKVGKALFTKETGLLSDSAKTIIKEEAQVRSASNLKNVDSGLGKISKARQALRGAAVIGVVVDAGIAGYKAYDKYQKGDIHGAKVEAARGAAGSVVGLAAGGAATYGLMLVFGVATGGVGLVLMGAVVAGASFAGGKWAENKVNDIWNGGNDE